MKSQLQVGAIFGDGNRIALGRDLIAGTDAAVGIDIDVDTNFVAFGRIELNVGERKSEWLSTGTIRDVGDLEMRDAYGSRINLARFFQNNMCGRSGKRWRAIVKNGLSAYDY